MEMKAKGKAKAKEIEIVNAELVADGKKDYLAKHKTATTLTDQQIDKLIQDWEGDEVDGEELVSAMRREEGGHDDEEAPVSVSATERDRDAIAFGEAFDKTHASEQIAAIVKARDELKWRPAHVAFFMLLEMDADMLAGAPEPGSKQKDDDGKIVNTHFDNRGPGKGSWWGDAYDSTTAGIQLAQRVAALKLVRDRDAAAPADLKAKGRKWAVKELEREDDRRSAGLRAMKDGYRLINRMRWCNENLRLQVIFVTVDEAGYNKDGKLLDTAKLEDTTGLIEVRCTVKRRDARFTVSEFMAVKVEEVAKHEDHFANFEVVRAKKKDTALQVHAIVNSGMFQQMLYEVHAWLDLDKSKGDVLAIIHTDEGPDVVESIMRTYNALEYFVGRKDVQEMYKKRMEQKKATDKTQPAAEPVAA